MPITPDQLFATLDRLGISHQTVAHPPIFTAEEGKDWDDKLPGLACKNLFLKDKKGLPWLVVMPAAKRADLSALAKRTNAGRFSFGNPAFLLEKLGITPGSVTPFALMNDPQNAVTVVLDSDMMAADLVNYHPLHNEASTAISPQDLLVFLRHLGRDPAIIDCGPA